MLIFIQGCRGMEGAKDEMDRGKTVGKDGD